MRACGHAQMVKRLQLRVKSATASLSAGGANQTDLHYYERLGGGHRGYAGRPTVFLLSRSSVTAQVVANARCPALVQRV